MALCIKYHSCGQASSKARYIHDTTKDHWRLRTTVLILRNNVIIGMPQSYTRLDSVTPELIAPILAMVTQCRLRNSSDLPIKQRRPLHSEPRLRKQLSLNSIIYDILCLLVISSDITAHHCCSPRLALTIHD